MGIGVFSSPFDIEMEDLPLRVPEFLRFGSRAKFFRRIYVPKRKMVDIIISMDIIIH
jgi:hypothetical protein